MTALRDYIQRQVEIFQFAQQLPVREDALCRIARALNLLPSDAATLNQDLQAETIAWLVQQGFLVVEG